MSKPGFLAMVVLTVVLLAGPVASAEVRPSILAGAWFPAEPKRLETMVRQYLDASPAHSSVRGELIALAVPHAGYMYSGTTAGAGYTLLKGRKIDTVVLIGPSHQTHFLGAAIDSRDYETPLGLVKADQEMAQRLIAESKGLIQSLPQVHEKEHCLEIQIPFLQCVLSNFKIIPVVMGSQDPETCRRLAGILARTLKNKNALIVCSTDLSHYHTAEQAEKMDQALLDRVAAFEPEELQNDLRAGQVEACGGGPLVAVMTAARLLGADRAELIKYSHSGQVNGDDSRVVGYMAAAFWKTTEKAADHSTPGIDLGLDDMEQQILLKAARSAIMAELTGQKPPESQNITKRLTETRGAFVTLKTNGRLRGCIGRLRTDQPLIKTVSQMAIQAAFHDPRFPPLDLNEVEDLTLEISVLTPFEQIHDINKIEVGTHGLMITRGYYQGLLLPQVPVEQGWDREQFLGYTCRKAGLAPDAWKKGASIYRFSAQVFGEKE